jgi:peroxiredoxin
MKRLYQMPITVLLCYGLLACANSVGTTTGENTNSLVGIPVKITGELKNFPGDTIRVYEYLGVEYNQLAAAAVTREGDKAGFSFSVGVPEKGMYFLGASAPTQAKGNGNFVLLGFEKEIQISGDLMNFEFKNSLENQEYKKFLVRVGELQQELSRLQQQKGQAPGHPEFDSLSKVLLDYQAEQMKKNTFAGKAAQLFYFPMYGSMPDHKTRYKTEIDYFKEGFFSNLKLNDPVWGYTTHFFEKANYYAAALSGQFGVPTEEIVTRFEKMIQQMTKGSRAVELLLIGGISGAGQAQQMDLYYALAEVYIKQFPEGRFAARLKQDLARGGNTRIGMIAPDIVSQDPDGKELKLSSLRGKVVMIDFWASWCGPCRKENPNVVRLYNRFKSKGFEIFGVSLDKDKQAWINAIKADNLTWPHVSDLGGWQSKPAQLYGVSSIPQTVLIDKEGKIIAKGLRGQALEQRLEQLLAN